jgi:hypothetical protein
VCNPKCIVLLVGVDVKLILEAGAMIESEFLRMRRTDVGVNGNCCRGYMGKVISVVAKCESRLTNTSPSKDTST